MDFCPAFWDWLIARNAANEVFSIEKVGDELLASADELSDWADDRGADFFLKTRSDAAYGIAHSERVGRWTKL